MQRLNSGFNKLKMDDSTHLKMLIIEFFLKNITKPFKYNCKILSGMWDKSDVLLGTHWLAYFLKDGILQLSRPQVPCRPT